MTLKTKRKHDPRNLFKLKMILLVFIIFTWIAMFFPMIWLAPPLFQFTPFVYIGLSLLWIPIVWRFRWRVVFDRLIRLLIVTVFVSSSLLILHYRQNLSTHLRCGKYQQHGITCMTSNNWCGTTLFINWGLVLVAREDPVHKPYSVCPLF